MKALLLTLGLLFSGCVTTPTELTSETLETETTELTGVVYFYAEGAEWSDKMSVIIDKLANEFTTISFTKINVVKYPDVNPGQVPGVAFLKDGVVLGYAPGYAEEEVVREFFKGFVKEYGPKE